jgi:hypothetical protein
LKQGFKNQFMQPEQKAQLEANYKKFYVKGWDKLLKKLKTQAAKC